MTLPLRISPFAFNSSIKTPLNTPPTSTEIIAFYNPAVQLFDVAITPVRIGGIAFPNPNQLILAANRRINPNKIGNSVNELIYYFGSVVSLPPVSEWNAEFTQLVKYHYATDAQFKFFMDSTHPNIVSQLGPQDISWRTIPALTNPDIPPPIKAIPPKVSVDDIPKVDLNPVGPNEVDLGRLGGPAVDPNIRIPDMGAPSGPSLPPLDPNGPKTGAVDIKPFDPGKTGPIDVKPFSDPIINDKLNPKINPPPPPTFEEFKKGGGALEGFKNGVENIVGIGGALLIVFDYIGTKIDLDYVKQLYEQGKIGLDGTQGKSWYELTDFEKQLLLSQAADFRAQEAYKKALDDYNTLLKSQGIIPPVTQSDINGIVAQINGMPGGSVFKITDALINDAFANLQGLGVVVPPATKDDPYRNQFVTDQIGILLDPNNPNSIYNAPNDEEYQKRLNILAQLYSIYNLNVTVNTIITNGIKNGLNASQIAGQIKGLTAGIKPIVGSTTNLPGTIVNIFGIKLPPPPSQKGFLFLPGAFGVITLPQKPLAPKFPVPPPLAIKGLFKVFNTQIKAANIGGTPLVPNP